ncbi:MAG: hypothetical protein H3C31_07625 [Brumimicrobium sp.]|nr:hypothetical protein [Brumimicrobium sp.]
MNNYRDNTFAEQDIYFKTATDVKLILSQKAPMERTHESRIGKALHALGFKIVSKRSEGYDYPRWGYYIVEKGS